jgi:hypothetical protein
LSSALRKPCVFRAVSNYNKLKEARDAAKTNRQNATEAEKELNQASEKLQKITATVDTLQRKN